LLSRGAAPDREEGPALSRPAACALARARAAHYANHRRQGAAPIADAGPGDGWQRAGARGGSPRRRGSGHLRL